MFKHSRNISESGKITNALLKTSFNGYEVVLSILKKSDICFVPIRNEGMQHSL